MSRDKRHAKKRRQQRKERTGPGVELDIVMTCIKCRKPLADNRDKFCSVACQFLTSDDDRKEERFG